MDASWLIMLFRIFYNENVFNSKKCKTEKRNKMVKTKLFLLLIITIFLLLIITTEAINTLC